MNFTFENQGTNTYLVYNVKDEEQLDTMSLGMLTNNKIPGLAASIFTQMDTAKYIKYNVSAKISAKQFFAGAVNKKRLIGVFSGIVDAMLSAEEYMIDTDTILLDMDYIFADVSTCETVLICLPLEGINSGNVEIGNFFKNIMFETQFDQTENCDHVAKIINYLNSTPVFSLIDFKTVLDGIRNRGTVDSEKIQQTSTKETERKVQRPNQKIEQSVMISSQQNCYQQPSTQQPVYAEAPVVQQAVPKRTVPTQATRPSIPQIPKPSEPQMQIPGKANIPAQEAETAAPDKPMSMMYLLNHYNKENAAAYKAQKAAKKESKNAAQNSMGNIPTDRPEKAKKTKEKKEKKGKQKNTQTTVPGFAMPGQTPPVSNFAVPGQTPPAPGQASVTPDQSSVAAGFVVPGQSSQFAVPQTPTANTQVPQPQVQQAPPVMGPLGSSGAIPQSHSGMTEKFIRSSANFGETTVLSSGGVGETTVLSQTQLGVQQQPQPYLVREKNNERIPINKPVFRIGKERSYVDYFIGDNTAISRSHANIISKDGAFFVMDTNSTNHTYVNGTMIQSNAEVSISSGTRIRFANEEFEFRMI